MTNPVLVARRISKVVPVNDGAAEELVILAAVDLEINAGESVAVVGASGSGKTTLLGILAGLDTPSDGSVSLDGNELTQLTRSNARACAARWSGSFSSRFSCSAASPRSRT